MTKIIIAYVPILHKGYMDFFTKHRDAREIYLLDPQLVRDAPELEYLAKKDSVRALTTSTVRSLLEMVVPPNVTIRTIASLNDVLNLMEINRKAAPVAVLPDEDVSRSFIVTYGSRLWHERTVFEPIFLRYDRSAAQKREDALSIATHSVAAGSLEHTLLQHAFAVAEKSADWWRHVGAVVAKDGQPLLWACNKHVPHEQVPYAFGDIRSLFKGGQMIELTTAEHAESVIVGTAARKGIALEGADLFITTFPCEPCAKIMARAGIKRCFFVEGSYGLATRELFEAQGVEVIHVKMPAS